MKVRLGASYAIETTLTDEIIDDFAEVSGDHNPVHVDKELAPNNRFGGRIGHGMWLASLISAVLGSHFPGAGTIYLGQNLQFRHPVRPGDTVTTSVRVVKLHDAKPIVTLETICRNGDGETLVDGEAVVLVEEEMLDRDQPASAV